MRFPYPARLHAQGGIFVSCSRITPALSPRCGITDAARQWLVGAHSAQRSTIRLALSASPGMAETNWQCMDDRATVDHRVTADRHRHGPAARYLEPRSKICAERTMPDILLWSQYPLYGDDDCAGAAANRTSACVFYDGATFSGQLRTVRRPLLLTAPHSSGWKGRAAMHRASPSAPWRRAY